MRNNFPTNLYIFVTSDAPDLYINIVGYCIANYSIKRIIFLGIIEDKGHLEKNNSVLTMIKNRVKEQLTLLQQGKYLYKDQKTYEWKQKEINLENYAKLRYAQIAQREIEIHTIIYDSLDDELTGFLQSGNCIFDVSGVLKGYLIDVYTLLRRKSVEDMYVFELRLSRRTHDEKELIHNLSLDDRDYEYVNVTRSKYTSGTIITTLDEIDKRKHNSAYKFLETLAGRFATNILVIYALLVIVVIALTTKLVFQVGWDKVEPWTFLFLVLFPYVVGLVLTIVLGKEFSIKPGHLYSWIKMYRLKMLTKRLEKN
jgi:hypothetical protein